MILVVGKMRQITLASLSIIFIALITIVNCDIFFENVPFEPADATEVANSTSNQNSDESDEIEQENVTEEPVDSGETADKRKCISCASPSLAALYTDFYASFLRPPTTYTRDCNAQEIDDDEVDDLETKSCATPCISLTDVIKAGGKITPNTLLLTNS